MRWTPENIETVSFNTLTCSTLTDDPALSHRLRDPEPDHQCRQSRQQLAYVSSPSSPIC